MTGNERIIVLVEGVLGGLFSDRQQAAVHGIARAPSTSARSAVDSSFLASMRQQRRHIEQQKRADAMKRTGGACYYCGAFATELDHFVPWSYVANDTLKNLIPSCSICNQIAHNHHFRTLADKQEYILYQRNTPKWRRKIARMEVIIVHVDQDGQPTGIVTMKRPK